MGSQTPLRALIPALPSAMIGPYPPDYYLQELSRSAGEAISYIFPSDSDSWWDSFRRHVVLVPGNDLQLRHNAPPELHDLAQSRIFQQLVRDKLEFETGMFVVFDNGVDSSILLQIEERIATGYGSVDAFLEAGHQLPNADYEQALRLLMADTNEAENWIFLVRWPAPRPRDGDADVTLPVTPMTAHVAAAIWHQGGPSLVLEFLQDDYSSVGKAPLLFEYFSCSAQRQLSRAQRRTIYTVLAVSHRLQTQQLARLPKEMWLHILAHIRIDELGRFCFGS